MDPQTPYRRTCTALACALGLAASSGAAALEPGTPVPDLAPRALEDPSHAVSLRALRGQVVYVDFWASWCVPCRLSMPALEALYRSHRAQGFTVVGVNKDVALADARRFERRVAVSFVLVSDGNDAVAKAFDVRAMPSGYLVDRRGIVRYVHRGFDEATAAALASEVESLLAEPS